MRKYEIHLPLSYNDGEPIEQEKISSAQDELSAYLVRLRFQIKKRGNMMA
jgi:hypothetical protein